MPWTAPTRRLYRAQEGTGPVLVFFSVQDRRQWIERAPGLRHVVLYPDRPRNTLKRAFLGLISTCRTSPTRN